MSLLDRTSSHDDAPDEEKDMLANEYLASFKVSMTQALFIWRKVVPAGWKGHLPALATLGKAGSHMPPMYVQRCWYHLGYFSDK